MFVSCSNNINLLRPDALRTAMVSDLETHNQKMVEARSGVEALKIDVFTVDWTCVM